MKVIHYAPYGPNCTGQFDCGAFARNEGYSVNADDVTCEECKKKSPGLWPPEERLPRIIRDLRKRLYLLTEHRYQSKREWEDEELENKRVERNRVRRAEWDAETERMIQG
jgi:hypothetical protein